MCSQHKCALNASNAVSGSAPHADCVRFDLCFPFSFSLGLDSRKSYFSIVPEGRRPLDVTSNKRGGGTLSTRNGPGHYWPGGPCWVYPASSFRLIFFFFPKKKKEQMLNSSPSGKFTESIAKFHPVETLQKKLDTFFSLEAMLRRGGRISTIYFASPIVSFLNEKDVPNNPGGVWLKWQPFLSNRPTTRCQILNSSLSLSLASCDR